MTYSEAEAIFETSFDVRYNDFVQRFDYDAPETSFELYYQEVLHENSKNEIDGSLPLTFRLRISADGVCTVFDSMRHSLQGGLGEATNFSTKALLDGYNTSLANALNQTSLSFQEQNFKIQQLHTADNVAWHLRGPTQEILNRFRATSFDVKQQNKALIGVTACFLHRLALWKYHNNTISLRDTYQQSIGTILQIARSHGDLDVDAHKHEALYEPVETYLDKTYHCGDFKVALGALCKVFKLNMRRLQSMLEENEDFDAEPTLHRLLSAHDQAISEDFEKNSNPLRLFSPSWRQTSSATCFIRATQSH